MDTVVTGTLQTLRDIQGIQGSFVVGNDDGQLLARDLPRFIDESALMQVGPRICRLLEVIESEQPMESSALRFADHRLDIRRLGEATLCVLADANVNLPALRMAMKLLCRKLEGWNWAVLAEEPAPETSKSTKAPEKAGPHGYYRGQKY